MHKKEIELYANQIYIRFTSTKDLHDAMRLSINALSLYTLSQYVAPRKFVNANSLFHNIIFIFVYFIASIARVFAMEQYYFPNNTDV